MPGAQFNAVMARLFLTNESVRLTLSCRTGEKPRCVARNPRGRTAPRPSEREVIQEDYTA